MTQTLRILDWNRKRNNLDFNPDLEAKMLTEEANEFFMAETLVDRLDAYLDFCFVATGTVGKYHAAKHSFMDNVLNDMGEMDQLVSFIEVKKHQMKEILLEELATYHKAFAYDDNRINEVFSRAMDIVITANEQKGTERNADGKVIKPVDFVKPETKLEALLREYGVDI